MSTSGHKVELHKQVVLSVNHPFIHTKYSILYYGSISFSLTACTGHPLPVQFYFVWFVFGLPPLLPCLQSYASSLVMSS